MTQGPPGPGDPQDPFTWGEIAKRAESDATKLDKEAEKAAKRGDRRKADRLRDRATMRRDLAKQAKRKRKG